MDRLSPSGKFNLWKLRVIPLLEAKAKKFGFKETTELLPTVLDDTLCTAYAQWLASHKDPPLKDALDFIENWMVNNRESSADTFLTRKWLPDESLEEYVAELEELAASLHIKSSDRAFKMRFVEGLPEKIQPFLRLEITGATWPPMSQLVEKAKVLKITPHGVQDVDAVRESSSCALNSTKEKQSGSRKTYSPRYSSIECFKCGGYGHVARVCPTATHQGNG
jgi:hypothetical protein